MWKQPTELDRIDFPDLLYREALEPIGALIKDYVEAVLGVGTSTWNFVPAVQAATGFLTVIIGAIVAYAALRQASVARQRHEAQTEADKQRRIVESFTKAVEQLGSDQLQVRLGGIYALERISRESPKEYYWPVMETLAGFVRERAAWSDENLLKKIDRPTDVEAVLSVIRRRSECRDETDSHLDMRSTDLRKANLAGAHLERADLSNAHLEGASLEGAHLKEADLSNAHLEGVNLIRAHVEGAWLDSANLSEARLFEAHLEEACLTSAHLQRAELFHAHLECADLSNSDLQGAVLTQAYLERANLDRANLEGAQLDHAHLESARLVWTNLKGAILVGAHIQGTLLAFAEGLEQLQINDAIADAKTVVPEHLVRPPHWPEWEYKNFEMHPRSKRGAGRLDGRRAFRCDAVASDE
jgi:uncharacterized protein YjbI with pentapeptide repeats